MYKWREVKNIKHIGKKHTPRGYHTLVHLPPDRFFFFGGYASRSSQNFNDCFIYNATTCTYTMIQTTGDIPSPRSGHVACKHHNKLIIFGGVSTNNSVYVLNLDTLEWKLQPCKNDENLLSRNCPSGIKWQDYLYVYGGDASGTFKDLWQLDLDLFSWREIPNNKVSSPKVYRHSCVIYQDKMYIYGGQMGSSATSHFFAFDFFTEEWMEVQHTGTSPGKRYAHGSVVCGNEMLVFGGSSCSGSSLNDLYSFHFPTGVWKKIEFDPSVEIPVKRVYFPTYLLNGRWYIFGGLSDGFPCEDVWYLDCKYAQTTMIGFSKIFEKNAFVDVIIN